MREHPGVQCSVFREEGYEVFAYPEHRTLNTGVSGFSVAAGRRPDGTNVRNKRSTLNAQHSTLKSGPLSLNVERCELNVDVPNTEHRTPETNHRILCFHSLTAAMLALLVQGAWAAGEVVSNTPPMLPSATAGTNDVIAAPWRDPFWPVGYLPPPDAVREAETNAAAAVAAPQSHWQEARQRLKIQGLTRGQSQTGGRPHYLAVINGRMVETGDRVSVELDGVRYRWRVQAIAAQGVTLEKVDAVPVGGVGGK